MPVSILQSSGPVARVTKEAAMQTDQENPAPSPPASPPILPDPMPFDIRQAVQRDNSFKTIAIMETMLKTYRKDYIFQQSMLKLLSQLRVDNMQQVQHMNLLVEELKAVEKKKEKYKKLCYRYKDMKQELAETTKVYDTLRREMEDDRKSGLENGGKVDLKELETKMEDLNLSKRMTSLERQLEKFKNET